jgi:chromate transporter
VNDNVLWSLARIFIPLSFITIGGGNSIIAGMKSEVVDVHHWMTAGQFVELFAISRAAPGPNSLLVSLIGFHVGGLPGALVATVAIFVPTSVIIYLVARIWRRHRGAAWQLAIERGLAPIAAGLILASVLTILRSIEGGILAWVVAGLAFFALRTTSMHPLVLLAAGAVVFMVVGVYWWPG